MEAFALTTRGRRELNEDTFHIDVDRGLFLVADGMGGHAGGEIASQLSVESIVEHFDMPSALETDDRLVASIAHAHDELLRAAHAEPDLEKMGTTIAALVVCEQERAVHIAHVGDSRVYRLREGVLEQLTLDHSLQNMLAASHGTAVAAAAPSHVITRNLGPMSDGTPDVRSEAFREADVYLLCSDGVTDVLSDEMIRESLAVLEPRLATHAILDHAYERGSTDNITVVIVEL